MCVCVAQLPWRGQLALISGRGEMDWVDGETDRETDRISPGMDAETQRRRGRHTDRLSVGADTQIGTGLNNQTLSEQ